MTMNDLTPAQFPTVTIHLMYFYIVIFISIYFLIYYIIGMCACMLNHFCHVQLCNAIDGSRPDSIHGIFQARIPEQVVMTSSRGSSQPRDQTLASCGSCVEGRFFTAEPPGKPHNLVYYVTYKIRSILLCCCCLVLSDSFATPQTDCSLPGSSVHGISQVRTLEQVAISFPRGFS